MKLSYDNVQSNGSYMKAIVSLHGTYVYVCVYAEDKWMCMKHMRS